MKTATARKLKAVPELLKVDLGCGQSKREGFLGVDKFKAPGVDQAVDLFTFPWPWKEGSVQEAHCSHFFEHVPSKIRGAFMDELFRVLVVGGTASFIVPYGFSARATQDFTHEWPPVTESSFLYFNRGWREANRLTHGHYALACDFDFTYGYAFDPEWQGRHEEARSFGIKHYLNVALDLHVTLTKRAAPK